MKRQRSFIVKTPAAKKPKFTRTGTMILAPVPVKRTKKRLSSLAVEKKFLDTSLVSAALTAPTDSTGGEFDPSATSMITTPAQGDGASSRDGKQIIGQYILIEGQITVPSIEDTVNPLNPMNVFVAVVLDTQTNGAQMNSEDCFTNPGASAVTACTPLKNLLFATRFKTLRKECFDMTAKVGTISAANAFSFVGQTRVFNWFIPLRNLKINFNSTTTATVAAVVDNSVHVIAFTNNTTPGVVISYNARFKFVG